MRKFELIAPCHFGLEAILKKEITDLGYEVLQVEDGKVLFGGDEEAVCRANLFLRTAERVLIRIGSFPAITFEELFQGTKDLPWESYIPMDGKFWVAKAASVKSKLFSPSSLIRLFRYPVDHEKGNRGKVKGRISYKLVSGRGGEFSAQSVYHERYGNRGA